MFHHLVDVPLDFDGYESVECGIFFDLLLLFVGSDAKLIAEIGSDDSDVFLRLGWFLCLFHG